MTTIASPGADKINARILSYEAKADFDRVESASRKINTSFYSPEVKRLFLRLFNSTQLHLYFISVIARTKLPHDAVETVEAVLRERIERSDEEVVRALAAAELLCKENAITSLATYDTAPLTFEVKVISPLARRYLELMTKVDQLMPVLETLAIDDLLRIRELDERKAQWKGTIKKVASTARSFAAGLRRRMNTLDSEAAPAQVRAAEGDAMAASAEASPQQPQESASTREDVALEGRRQLKLAVESPTAV